MKDTKGKKNQPQIKHGWSQIKKKKLAVKTNICRGALWIKEEIGANKLKKVLGMAGW